MASNADQETMERRFMRSSLAHARNRVPPARATHAGRPGLKAALRAGVMGLLGLGVTACSTVDSLLGSSTPPPGAVGSVQGFLGGTAADEPLAAIAGRDALSSGGNAADAAVAMLTTMWVTYPSRAGIGGGGACLAYFSGDKGPNAGVPEAILFPAAAPADGGGGTRPIALPMAARGMFLLHSRYGSRPIETYLAQAEQMARFGIGASRALVSDMGVVGPALFSDPGARSVFAPNGVPLAEGDALRQPELAATLSGLRVSGVGDLYQGALARRIQDMSPRIGGPLTVDQLRAALPTLAAPLLMRTGRDTAAFLPPPADGGLAAAVAFKALMANSNDVDGAAVRAEAAASAWRAGGVGADALLNGAGGSGYPLPPLPASTSMAVLDRSGNAVVCSLSMNNLFGTGRIIPDLGILAAASPSLVPPPLLSAGIIWNENVKAFRAAVAGSGQSGAPMAVALGLYNTMRTQVPMSTPVPEPGRANIVACGRYLPSESASCGWATDPRGFGLAAGGS